MKRSLLAGLVLTIAAGSPALATLTFYDPFNYPGGDGATTSLGGNTDLSFSPRQQWFTGVGKNGNLTNDPKTTGGNLSYPGLPASTGGSLLLNNVQTNQTIDRVDISRYVEPAAGSPAVTLYYSMILQVTDTTGLTNTTTGSFLAGLQYNYPEAATQVNDGMTDSTSIAAGTLNIHKDPIHSDATTTRYNLGIAVRDQPAAQTRVFDTTGYAAGDTLFVVAKYVMGSGNKDDAAYLYINPSSSTFGHADPNTWTVHSNSADFTSEYDYFYDSSGNREIDSGGVPLTTLRTMFLRNNSVEPAHIQIDDLRVGTTWADVTRNPIPGDANDDAVVTRDDYALIDRGFAVNIPLGQTHYSDGDFNFDGKVDSADYLIIDTAFLSAGNDPGTIYTDRLAQFGPDYVAALEAAVPEPASVGVMTAACAGIALRRARRQ